MPAVNCNFYILKQLIAAFYIIVNLRNYCHEIYCLGLPAFRDFGGYGQVKTRKSDIVLVVHGGAGTILKSQMTQELEKAYTDGLAEALKKGMIYLKRRFFS